MGIKGMYNLIKDECPDELCEYHFSDFIGASFAIDISIFLYKYIKTCGDSWMNQFIMLLLTLKKYGIKSVCIFDGPNPPPEKLDEQNKRRDENEKSRVRYIECKKMLEQLEELSTADDNIYDIEVSDDIKEKCRILIGQRSKVQTNYCSIQDIMTTLSDVIVKLELQLRAITNTDRENAKRIVDMLGLACFQADGEAESLCCYLANKGFVDAVLTEDTDVLAYGVPLMLSFKDHKISDEMLFGVSAPSLVKSLKLTHPEFLDLCIMMRCDYNKHEPSIFGWPPDGKKRKKACSIGVKGALCLIREYRRLEEVERYVEDIRPLKYRRCRELLTIPDYVDSIVIPYNQKPDFKEVEKLINEYSLSINLKYIQDCWKPVAVVFEE